MLEGTELLRVIRCLPPQDDDGGWYGVEVG
jgi:hypothetical protein